MPTALQPMSTGQVLDRTFNLYRSNFMLFAGIATVAALSIVCASLVLVAFGIAMPKPGVVMDPRVVMNAVGVYVLVLILFWLIFNSLATAATIYAVSKRHLGETVTMRESYGKVFPLLGRIVWIVVRVFLRMIGAILAAYVVAIVAAAIIVPALTVTSGGSAPGSLAFIVIVVIVIAVMLAGYGWAIYIYCKYSFAVPACLLEKMKAYPSLKRSAFLSKSSRFRIFLVHLLAFTMSLALAIALSYGGNLLLGLLRIPFLLVVWGLVASFLATTLAFPIGTIAISLLYYDQRVRKEAFDLQLMMESLSQAGSQEVAVAMPIG